MVPVELRPQQTFVERQPVDSLYSGYIRAVFQKDDTDKASMTSAEVLLSPTLDPIVTDLTALRKTLAEAKSPENGVNGCCDIPVVGIHTHAPLKESAFKQLLFAIAADALDKNRLDDVVAQRAIIGAYLLIKDHAAFPEDLLTRGNTPQEQLNAIASETIERGKGLMQRDHEVTLRAFDTRTGQETEAHEADVHTRMTWLADIIQASVVDIDQTIDLPEDGLFSPLTLESFSPIAGSDIQRKAAQALSRQYTDALIQELIKRHNESPMEAKVLKETLRRLLYPTAPRDDSQIGRAVSVLIDAAVLRVCQPEAISNGTLTKEQKTLLVEEHKLNIMGVYLCYIAANGHKGAYHLGGIGVDGRGDVCAEGAKKGDTLLRTASDIARARQALNVSKEKTSSSGVGPGWPSEKKEEKKSQSGQLVILRSRTWGYGKTPKEPAGSPGTRQKSKERNTEATTSAPKTTRETVLPFPKQTAAFSPSPARMTVRPSSERKPRVKDPETNTGRTSRSEVPRSSGSRSPSRLSVRTSASESIRPSESLKQQQRPSRSPQRREPASSLPARPSGIAFASRPPTGPKPAVLDGSGAQLHTVRNEEQREKEVSVGSILAKVGQTKAQKAVKQEKKEGHIQRQRSEQGISVSSTTVVAPQTAALLHANTTSPGTVKQSAARGTSQHRQTQALALQSGGPLVDASSIRMAFQDALRV